MSFFDPWGERRIRKPTKILLRDLPQGKEQEKKQKVQNGKGNSSRRKKKKRKTCGPKKSNGGPKKKKRKRNNGRCDWAKRVVSGKRQNESKGQFIRIVWVR